MLVCDTEIKLSLGVVENHLEGKEEPYGFATCRGRGVFGNEPLVAMP